MVAEQLWTTDYQRRFRTRLLCEAFHQRHGDCSRGRAGDGDRDARFGSRAHVISPPGGARTLAPGYAVTLPTSDATSSALMNIVISDAGVNWRGSEEVTAILARG